MLSTSFAFRKKISQNTKTVHKATLTLADGTVLEIEGTDLMAGTSFSESVSSQASFDVGAAIIGRHDFTLRNDEGKYDEYDFTGSTVVPFVGVELDDGTAEWLRKGVFGIEQPNSYGNTIALTSLDNMRLLERPYSDVATAYPATLARIASDICTACGLTLYTTAFANSSVVVQQRPTDGTLTCLDMISNVAQSSGNWAKCDNAGRLCFDWYDLEAFEGNDWLDGGTFDTTTTPYSDGDAADGGAFHTGGANSDGGGFGAQRYIHLHAFANLTVVTDDVVITGVRVTAANEITADGSMGEVGETALYGSEGYVLDISGNALIQYGTASAAASRIGLRCVGMRFRPFDASVVGNPAYEAGDPVIITDAKQRQYRSYLTSTTWRSGSYQAVSCGAETPSRNSADTYSAMTKAIIALRNAAAAERTARELATETMALLLSSASGLYKTAQQQPDGSMIYYMHDKPTLAQSATVWKATAEAFGVSTDGGQTYAYGVSNNGVAILNQIYAVGLDADYINTGSLTVCDPADATDVLFKADVDLGEVLIGGFNVNDSALFNGPAALTSDTPGVYVGEDGVRVNKAVGNNKYGAKLTDGTLEFDNTDGSVGIIDGSGWGSSGCMFISGTEDGIVLHAPKMYVDDGNQNVLYGSGVETVTETDTGVANNNLYATRFVPQSMNNNVLTGYMRVIFPKYINGLLVGATVNYWNAVGSGNIDIPLKAYVDAVDDKIPTFSLSGNNLFITT